MRTRTGKRDTRGRSMRAPVSFLWRRCVNHACACTLTRARVLRLAAFCRTPACLAAVTAAEPRPGCRGAMDAPRFFLAGTANTALTCGGLTWRCAAVVIVICPGLLQMRLHATITTSAGMQRMSWSVVH